MIHINKNPIRLTITLQRLTGGVWAYRDFKIRMSESGEEAVLKTNEVGICSISFLPQEDSQYEVLVDDIVVGIFAAPTEDISVSFRCS